MKRDINDMLSSLYGFFAQTKNVLYDSGFADSVRIQPPVLSVGNLSVGGTGKTPVVEKILEMALERRRKPAIVSRNYRAKSRGIHLVDIHKEDGADFYGDEPFSIARSYPEVPVWTGPKKYLTAQEATSRSALDLLIVDDGFQHRALHRDFDLVLLDCTAAADEDFLLPQGRLRESFKSLQRAQAVALTKVNWADPQRVLELRSKIPDSVEVFELEFHQSTLRPVEVAEPLLLVSGIAKPFIFERNLRNMKLAIQDHLIFSDHEPYGATQVHKILEAFDRMKCTQILTTEKDYVKLSRYPELRDRLNTVKVSAEFIYPPKGLYAFLD